MPENNSAKHFIQKKTIYIQEIIQNTIISIKNNKKSNLFSENDITLSTSILIDLYTKTSQLQEDMIEKQNKSEEILINELQKIIDKLSLVICGFGTKYIDDLLYVTFGSEFKNLDLKNEYINAKYKLIKQYGSPIGYKIITNKTKKNIKTYDTVCCEKISENIISNEELNNIECIDDKDNFDTSNINKLHYIKMIIHNNTVKKSIIINLIVEDMPLNCLTNEYTYFRINELSETLKNYDNEENEIFKNIIMSLSLKDLLVFGKNDIIKRIFCVLKEINYVKQTHIDIVVKDFLKKDIYMQRDFLLNLLLYKEDSDVQHVCYILYDLINTVTNETNSETIGNKLYESFPWNIRQNFKNIVKTNIQNTQQIMQKYEINKVSLEQQIYLLKVDEVTKEKAINKLKEMNGKPDDMTIKIRQYLEGLVKIPFDIYYEEPIIKIMKTNNEQFLDFLKNYNKMFSKVRIENKSHFTNKEMNTLLTSIETTTNKYIKDNIQRDLQKCSIKKLNQIMKIIKQHLKTTNEKNMSISKKSKNNLYNQILHYFFNESYCNSIMFSIFDEIYNENFKTINFKKELNLLHSSIESVSKNISKMETILDNSIHGHTNAKNQILKIIGQWMNGEKSGYSFGFEGSPGIGKTSLASKGLTKCLMDNNNNSRPFNFIAIGGSSNGSFLEGHGYTYMNSTWGKIVDILMDSKCMNPIIYVDELDKVSKTEQGKEIIGILTHLIDPTQNTNFQDKYFSGINIDVSKILFIFSYNDPEQIDKVLLDRIHRIKFENLTINEKITIVNKFILPEVNKKMGFENIVKLNNKTIEYLIKSYTAEPGVRKLKEILFDLYGEINLRLLKNTESNEVPITISVQDLENDYLIKYNKINEKKIHTKPEVGIINGLWANSLGMGGIIPIQTLFYPSSTFLTLQLTGLQGDVMKESMNVAKSLAWNLTKDDIKQDWLQYFEKTKCQGLHIHCPEGAISKDGPSAGVAITVAIYSLLNKKKIKNDIAITGEITLSGDITAIGGLDIKISSGIRNGVKTFLFPKENEREFQIWIEKTEVKNNIEFIKISNIKEVFQHVFV